MKLEPYFSPILSPSLKRPANPNPRPTLYVVDDFNQGPIANPEGNLSANPVLPGELIKSSMLLYVPYSFLSSGVTN